MECLEITETVTASEGTLDTTMTPDLFGAESDLSNLLPEAQVSARSWEASPAFETELQRRCFKLRIDFYKVNSLMCIR